MKTYKLGVKGNGDGEITDDSRRYDNISANW